MSRTETTFLPATPEQAPASSFQQRLLQRMKDSNKNIAETTRRHIQCSAIPEVRTLQDYKREVIDENDGKWVVVWFYAPWCRSCKGVSKGVLALSREYEDVKFIQVPVLAENSNLHQGLDVTSVPFVHLYHPTAGLVEERKLTKKYLPGFRKILKDCYNGVCSLRQNSDNQWSTSSPYDPPPESNGMDEGSEVNLSTTD